MRWPLFDWIADLIGSFWVSWCCWGLGAQRNAVQRADADWLLCVGVVR